MLKEKAAPSLFHYGILGMRWGIRRPRGADGRVVTTGSADHKEARALQRRGIENLTTNELKVLTQRLQLERQHRDLSPDLITRGRLTLQNVAAFGGTVTSLYSIATSPMARGVVKAIRSRMSK